MKTIPIGKSLEVIVDDAWYPRLSGHRWFPLNGYAYNGELGLMHRHIMGQARWLAQDAKVVVDHINRDKLDNRTENLRLVSRSVNGLNSDSKARNTSGVVGVGYHKQSDRWRAYIGGPKNRKIRYFLTRGEAENQRKTWEIEAFGGLTPRWGLDKAK